MKSNKVSISNRILDVYSLNTVIVGSGAASLNAANTLYEMGQKDIVILTEGMNKGTSRNTGSDKQTYYKMSTCGHDGDSPYKMAETLFNGGAMHGDIALVEASLSTMTFYNLARIGVPFPHDQYGQYVGYKTDHDPYTRASSAGPLTSKYMTQKLEEQVKKKEVKIFDHYKVISILTDESKTKSVGLLAINLKDINQENYGFTLFNCQNIIYGTGGPGAIYFNSVYPKSQLGMTGIALEAGAKANNLTEWQYGLASIKYRWNVSGTYQQVIPRYVSTDQDGKDEKEFLMDYFSDIGKMMDAVFLKGYQWPFDPRKMDGSSIIDILVYIETQIKGRRVFLDFTKNPCSEAKGDVLDFSLLGHEAYDYLDKSNACFGKPIVRLEKMNPLAIELYKENGINIEHEYLEIDVCAQHNNGGLLGNIWWESNLKHFFPVGEVNGTLGVYRPGGSALNSTQVGSYRAAQYISKVYKSDPISSDMFMDIVRDQILNKINLVENLDCNINNESNVMQLRALYQKRMTRNGAFIRDVDNISSTIEEIKSDIMSLVREVKIKDIKEIQNVFTNYDILITQWACLSAMESYIKEGGQSRGSYIVLNDKGNRSLSVLGKDIKFSIDDDLSSKICETSLNKKGCDMSFLNQWQDVRPIPKPDMWFETVWEEYRKDNIFN